VLLTINYCSTNLVLPEYKPGDKVEVLGQLSNELDLEASPYQWHLHTVLDVESDGITVEKDGSGQDAILNTDKAEDPTEFLPFLSPRLNKVSK
jgi:hypothetical protein